jgi:acyl-coenzyme A thioesterase PaaI-like protein
VTDHAAADVPENLPEMRRLADAMRRLMSRFVATTAPPEVFTGLADELDAITAQLEAYPQAALYFGYAEAANAGDAGAAFDHSPLMGRANPLAPPIEMAFDGDRVVGRVRFGPAYEGPPGCVHGGFVAATFDELLGLTQSLSGTPGMTGRLIVHYRHPTPLQTDLRLEGRIDRVEGRKIFTKGWLYAGDVLVAEAEGLFISIEFARFQALRAAREARQTGDA